MDLISDLTDTGGLINLAKENVLGVFSNLTLLNFVFMSLMRDKPFPKTKNTFEEEYDYIIIGGGSAGSVMANRLSQKSCVRVLLLEAGGEGTFLTDVPAYSRLFLKTDIDWAYTTTPQQYSAFGQNENRVSWNSGKVLGGGSTLNAMLFVRGNRENYDNWEAEGATGWSYEDVLPYFLKLEDNRNIEELDPGYHETARPMTVEKPNYTPEFKNPVIRALQAMGYQITDINGRRQTGISDLQGTLRNGQRCSTSKAYLVPAEDRPNLTILKTAFARKILIEDKKAQGVEFDFDGNTYTVYASKEVIVSSGTVRTAQILMLSGIGPREHLESFGVPVVADLPVGQNLHDHPNFYMPYTVNSTITPIFAKVFSPVNVLQYISNRSGLLTAPNQNSVLAFVDGDNATNSERDFPKVQLYFAEYDALDAEINWNLKREVFNQVYKPYVGKPSYVCIVQPLQPKSRGEILLNSTNPYEQPLINPNYLKEDEDVKDMVAGMKICNSVSESPEMRAVQAKAYETVYSGCEEFVGVADSYLECQARSAILSAYHPVGTTRMGQPGDPRSVVDPQLRIIGIDGLRVINAAVMPIITSGNTNVPVMMLAEKAYDMMKDDMICRTERRLCLFRGSCGQCNRKQRLF